MSPRANLLRFLAVLGLLACLIPAIARTQPAADTDSLIYGGVSTLYALDPLSRSLSFTDGRPGHVIHNNRMFNRNSDINFGNYLKDGFSVGIEGGRLGNLVDLGTAEEFAKRTGFQETGGNGQGYASLHFEKDQLVTLKDYRTGEFQALKEADALFETGKSSAGAPAIAGHIYLARLTESRDPGFELVVKFICIAHTPNESATIRWEVLRRTEGTRR
jgi:hypothetical protein